MVSLFKGKAGEIRL